MIGLGRMGGNMVQRLLAETAVVAQEEIFGPVLPLIPFNTDEEAVSIVNSTAYALTLSIFSRSPSTIKKFVKACRAGNIYVNRKITGARVGIEPFGGMQLSGTGPKTGGEEYVLAFLTRRKAYRSAPMVGRQVQTSPASVFAVGVRPWDSTPVAERQSVLTAALDILTHNESKLARALSLWKGVGRGKAMFLADRVLEIARKVLAAVPEIAEMQPTVEIPGQTNFVLWNTPRGVGVAATDDGADPASLAALVCWVGTASLFRAGPVLTRWPNFWSVR